MSMGVLLQAVRDHLRSNLVFPGNGDGRGYVDIQPEGRPPATIADYYYGIDEDSIESGDRTHLKERFTLSLVITKTAAGMASDRRGSLYLENSYGLDALERAAIRLIHGSQTLRLLANQIGGFPSTTNGDAFEQPLWYLGRGKTQPADGEWAGLMPEKRQFLVRTLRFGGAIRVQSLNVMH